MSRIFTLSLVALTVFVAACEDKPQGTAGTTPPAASAAIQDDDLLTQADFDDEAEKAITETNYKAEADALEKEIDSAP